MQPLRGARRRGCGGAPRRAPLRPALTTGKRRGKDGEQDAGKRARAVRKREKKLRARGYSCWAETARPRWDWP